MNTNTIYKLFIISALFLSTFSKELPTSSEESSKILKSDSSFGPHVEPSSTRTNQTGALPSSRRTASRTRLWTPITTVSPSPVITTTMAMNLSETEVVHQKWNEFQRSMKKTIDGHMKKALPKFLRMSSDAKISAECSKGIMALIQGIRGLKSWAFRMLDASSKLPSGILDGTLTDLGDYDECMNIEKLDSKKRLQFTGQYCSLDATPLLPPVPHRVQFKTVVLDVSNFSDPDSVLTDLSKNANMFYLMTLRLGICLPSSCSVADVQELANFGVGLKEIPFKVKVDRCEVKQPFQVSNLQIACLTIIGFLVLLAAIGTFIDVKTSSPFNTFNKVFSGIAADSLKCFSVEKNLKKILQINESKENFGVLNGLRVISMVWVVLCHTYGFSFKQGLTRMQNAKDTLNEVTFGTVINAWIIVDTFFVLGAFLVAHSNLKSLEKENGRLNFLRYYVHRIWRLTPPVAGALLVMFLLPLLGSGPLFKDVIGHQVGNCEKYWWQALIIPINTWTHFDDMCMLHTWYIASDMHLYFIAPLIFIPLYKWPAIGFMIMVILTAACMGIVAILTIIYDFYPTLLYFTPNESFTQFQCDLMYFRPYPHMGAYCVGIALAYIVLHYKKVDLKPLVPIHWWTNSKDIKTLSRRFATKTEEKHVEISMYQVLGWLAAIVCNLAVLYSAFEWNRGNLPSKTIDIVYAVTHRTAWAMGIAWIVYICITGRGGVVNRFLSWNLFIPLGRLSYSCYILHFPVLWARNGLRRRTLHFHHYDIFLEFIATLALTLILSISFHLLFEAPFLNLEEVWFPKNGRKLKKSTESEVTIVTVAKKIEN